MEAKVVRENTLKLKFGAQSRNPSNAEVFAFFQKQGWDCDMLSAMYREDYSLFIKFQKEDTLKDALRKLGHQVMFEYENGTKVQVAVSASNGMFKYVRVFGLPPEVDDKHIVAVFAKYGTIQQMVRERYPAESGFPIWSGVRGLNMEVLQEIPAQVYVQSIKARVFYEGIQHKCYLCGSTEHLKAECPKRKSVNTRLASYAHPPVNRAGLNNESVSAGSVILPIPGGSVKSVKGTSSASTDGAAALPMVVDDIDGAAGGAQADLASIGDLNDVDSAVQKKGEAMQAGAGSVTGAEWQLVKRLRSRDSNGGVVAKCSKIDDRKGLSLLGLQGRRSRSLTPRQKKCGTTAKQDEIAVDSQQFPPLGNS